jgi:hypothetical protein
LPKDHLQSRRNQRHRLPTSSSYLPPVGPVVLRDGSGGLRAREIHANNFPEDRRPFVAILLGCFLTLRRAPPTGFNAARRVVARDHYFECDAISMSVHVWVQESREGSGQQVGQQEEYPKSQCVQDADGTKEKTQYRCDHHVPNHGSDDSGLAPKRMRVNHRVSRLC